MLDEQGGSIRTTAAIRALSLALGERLVAAEVLTVRPTHTDEVEVRADLRRARRPGAEPRHPAGLERGVRGDGRLRLGDPR
jgi:sarcosine oxidase